MIEFEIRRFAAVDAPQVAALWERTFPNESSRNAPDRVIRQKMATQGELFFVASLAGRIVGTVLAGYDGCRGWIYHLAVHPDHQRTGFGRRMMEEAEAALRALGCPKINLQVRSDNDGVVQFYEGLGYVVEPRLSLGKPLD